MHDLEGVAVAFSMMEVCSSFRSGNNLGAGLVDRTLASWFHFILPVCAILKFGFGLVPNAGVACGSI